MLLSIPHSKLHCIKNAGDEEGSTASGITENYNNSAEKQAKLLPQIHPPSSTTRETPLKLPQ